MIRLLSTRDRWPVVIVLMMGACKYEVHVNDMQTKFSAYGLVSLTVGEGRWQTQDNVRERMNQKNMPRDIQPPCLHL